MTTLSLRNHRLPLHLACLLSIAAATPALAQTYTQTQTFPFNFSNSGASLPMTIANEGDFTATAQPFNPAAGTLISFVIAWDIDFTASGIATADNAYLGGGVGGGFDLAGIDYGGTGDGSGDLALQNQPVTFTFNISDTKTVFVRLVSGGEDAAMLAAVLGASAFPLDWDSDYVLTGNDMASISGTAIGSVRLTYTYLPEASTNAAMGLAFVAAGGVVWRRRRQGAAAEVTQAATK